MEILSCNVGVSVDEITQQLIASYETEQRIFQAHSLKSEIQDINNRNIWEIVDEVETAYKSFVKSRFIKFVNLEKLNWDYLGRLLQFESADSDHKKVSYLRKLIDDTPICFLYINDFNAFLSQDTKIFSTPPIFHFHQVTQTCEFFSFLLTPIIYESVVEKDKKSIQIPYISRKKIFQRMFIQAIEVLLGKRISFDLKNLPYEVIGVFQKCKKISILCNSFFIFHELGHLLLGHLERKSQYAIEYEADLLANDCFINSLKI